MSTPPAVEEARRCIGTQADLSPRALASLRTSLEIWQSPVELHRFLVDFRNRISGRDFFNKGGLSFLREAMIAADFGLARRASSVRLIAAAEERPDFEMLFDANRFERFELVEADRTGRRRGAEYAARHNLPPNSTYSIHVPLDGEILEMVRRAASKKAKCYPADTRLLIYLNAFRCSASVAEKFPNAVLAAQPFFSAVWIICGRDVYPVATAMVRG